MSGIALREVSCCNLIITPLISSPGFVSRSVFTVLQPKASALSLSVDTAAR